MNYSSTATIEQLIVQFIAIWIFCLGFALLLGTVYGTPMGNVKKTNTWFLKNIRNVICWFLKVIHDFVKPGKKQTKKKKTS